MVRGAIKATPKIEVNYATAYFSTLSRDTPFDSDRDIGARAGIFPAGSSA